MTKKWYVVQYYDGRNGHTYRQPVKAETKTEARARVCGSTKEIKQQLIKKIKVTLFR